DVQESPRVLEATDAHHVPAIAIAGPHGVLDAQGRLSPAEDLQHAPGRLGALPATHGTRRLEQVEVAGADREQVRREPALAREMSPGGVDVDDSGVAIDDGDLLGERIDHEGMQCAAVAD